MWCERGKIKIIKVATAILLEAIRERDVYNSDSDTYPDMVNIDETKLLCGKSNLI